MSNDPTPDKPETDEVDPPIAKRRRRVSSKFLPQQVFATIAGLFCLVGLVYLMTLLTKRMIKGPTSETNKTNPTEVTKSTTSTILGGKTSGEFRNTTTKEASASAESQTPTTSLSNVAKFEVATLKEGVGPAYNAVLTNLPLAERAIPLDSKEALETRAQLELYLKTDGWREKLSFVFEPDRVRASLRDYYERRGEEEPVPGKLMGASQITSGGSTIISLYWGCASRVVPGLRAHFHRTNAGQWLLDWEAWVALSEKSWPEMKKERLAAPTMMRAVASEDDYYNYEFAPEKWRYLAVKLRSPDGVHSLTGYCHRASGLGVAMANLIGVPLPQSTGEQTPGVALRPPGTQTSVAVRIAFPPSAQSNHCVWITDLLADRWLLFEGEY